MMMLTEADLQHSIVLAAREFGWLAYATYRSLRSEPGFPDLVLVKPPRVIFAELKTTKGKLSKGHWNKAGSRWLPGQDDWGEAFRWCPGVEYALWRPADLEAIYRTLQGLEGSPSC